MIAQTSRQVYHEITTDGTVQTLEQKVLKAFGEKEAWCIGELASYLKLDKSCASARMNSLKKKGLIELVGKKKSADSGKICEFWTTKSREQANLF